MHILHEKWQETGWPHKYSFALLTTKVLSKLLLPFHCPVTLSILQIGSHHEDASQIAFCPSYHLLSRGEWSTGTQQIARGVQYFKGHYARLLALEQWQWLSWQQAYIHAKDPATSTAVGVAPGIENSCEIPAADMEMKLPQALKKPQINLQQKSDWGFPFHCLSQAKVFFWNPPP